MNLTSPKEVQKKVTLQLFQFLLICCSVFIGFQLMLPEIRYGFKKTDISFHQLLKFFNNSMNKCQATCLLMLEKQDSLGCLKSPEYELNDYGANSTSV